MEFPPHYFIAYISDSAGPCWAPLTLAAGFAQQCGVSWETTDVAMAGLV